MLKKVFTATAITLFSLSSLSALSHDDMNQDFDGIPHQRKVCCVASDRAGNLFYGAGFGIGARLEARRIALHKCRQHSPHDTGHTLPLCRVVDCQRVCE